MSKSIFPTSLNSHLITYNPHKVAVIRGYIERVSGMLLSQYIDTDGHVLTNRTILTEDEMIPDSNICSSDEDWNDGIHIFKTFPNLTMEDVSKTIRSTKGVRFVNESFDSLREMGCIVPEAKDDIVMTIHDHKKEYSLYSKELGLIELEKGWIPSSLGLLYSIQSFLKRRIRLKTSDVNPVNEDSLNLMNEILENQMKHLVFTNGERSEALAYNDGVKSYYKSGAKVDMTREEFLSKYPDSYEVEG